MAHEDRLSHFFLGLGLGTAVGMLLAPKAGAQTRNDIQNKMREGSEYIKRPGQELRDTGTDTFARQTDAAEPLGSCRCGEASV
jgi:gas vesicle protein